MMQPKIKCLKTLPVVVLKRLDKTPTPAKRGRGRPKVKTEEVLKEIEEAPKIIEEKEEDDEFNSEELRNNFLKSLDSDEDGDDEEGDSDKENSTPKWKPITGKNRRPLAPVVCKKPQLSEYEMIREKNIAEQRLLFLQHMKSLSSAAVARPPQDKRPRKQRSMDTMGRKRPRKEYSTRSKTGQFEKETPQASGEEYSDDDEEEMIYSPKKRRSHPSRWFFNPNEDILMPEDVTEEMLDNCIDDFVSNKVYDQGPKGSTCHQCRQKTRDQKTICRSGHCAGGRGMFCGVCLKNRYGMDIKEALKDANWWCPPCMDYCNCSICRNRIGKGATGPLTWLAQEKGFPSVRHYLDSLVKTK